MIRRSSVILVLLALLPFLKAEAYTVVMKNGKTIKGTVISETADGLVFKDESGLQYSLKKSNLDLEKMEEANKPQAAPAPPPPADSSATPSSPTEPAQPPAPPQTPKPARVYTQEDINRLRGASDVADDTDADVDVEDTGDPYVDTMHAAGAVLGDLIGKYQSLASQLASVYDIASTSGADGNAAAQKFVAGQTGASILHDIDADVSRLNKLKNSLPTTWDIKPAGVIALDQALDMIPDLRSDLAAPHILSAKDFQSRVDKSATLLTSLSQSLLDVQAAGTKPPKPKSDDDEDQSDQDQ